MRITLKIQEGCAAGIHTSVPDSVEASRRVSVCDAAVGD